MVLDQRGEAFDPVAVVAVQHPVDLADLGVVDVPAHDAVEAAFARLGGQRGLEVAHVADRTLDLELQEARQAPVRQTEPRARRIEAAVQLEREFIGGVARIGEPLGALDHAVEQVAVSDPQTATVGQRVHAFLDDVHATEVVRHIAARKFIVVAGHKDHPRALACLAQDLLHHVVVALRPVPGAAQLPAVDDVAHQIQRLAFGGAQEFEQRARLAARRAQVQIRDPDRANVQGCVGFGVVHAGGRCVHGRSSSRREMTRC